MSAPTSPPSAKGAAPRARANYANPGMRVSDAERAEVADRLSAHYGEGRLDEEEFGRRLDQAMNATTQADLHGLFADLPDGDAPPATAIRAGKSGGTPPNAPRPRPRHGFGRILGYILIAIVAVFAVHSLGWLLPWALVAILVLAWLRHGRRQQHRL
jgi:hypothetical protein